MLQWFGIHSTIITHNNWRKYNAGNQVGPKWFQLVQFCHSYDREYLSWPSLELRLNISRLQTLYNIINEHYSLAIPPHFISMGRSTRFYHPSHYVLPNAWTNSYQQSFYPRSIKDWNNLLIIFSWTALTVYYLIIFCNYIVKLSV